MNKYIIEIEEKPLCVFDEDTQTYFPRLWRVKGFNSLVFDEEGLSRLEELNSDYINEHFGDLQDTAYQKGFEDGKAVNDKGCEGCKYSGTPQGDSPCFNCSNYYKNNWTAKSDKIEVGDEVNWLGDCFIVTRIFQPHNMKEQCDGIDDDGCVYRDILMDDLEKTGRHFDIASILEAMKHD